MSPRVSGGSSQGPPIQAGIGAGFFGDHFGGKGFIACLIELIKNCRDWGASTIRLVTTDRSCIRIFDNGRGMDRRNRDAFASVNMTTASGPRQSGRFCTGTKQMLYSHNHSVRVRTAPQDEPDKVYIFAFTAEEYEDLALSRGTIIPEVVEKTSDTWDYLKPENGGCRFGTEIVYNFSDPRSRKLVRGSRLAQELSARLPLKFADGIVYVDGDPIPPKDIIGRSFEVTDNSRPDLGAVTLELYRPANRRAEEDLRVTGAEVGEAPFSNLVRVLGDVRSQVPELYCLKDVCGTISAPFLSEYANEDRFTIDPRVVDDPRTLLLLQLLRRYAPAVQKALRIKLRHVDSGDDAEVQDIAAVAEQFNSRYGSEAAPPPGGPGCGPHGPTPPGSGDPPPDKSPLYFKGRHGKSEFEVGEVYEFGIGFRGVLKDNCSLSDIQWNFERAGGSVVMTEKGVKLTARTVGTGIINADLPGTPYKTKAIYQIVDCRRLSLSTGAYIQVERGSELIITVKNVDKVQGVLSWHHEGVGELVCDGDRATFRATGDGSASVEIRDSGDPNATAVTEVLVAPPAERRQLICIRGQWFAIDLIDSDAREFQKPVTMIPGNPIHTIMVNRQAPGYRNAKRKGELQELLRVALSQEFPRFRCFDLESMDLASFDGRDLPLFVVNLQSEGYTILEEILAVERD